MAQDGGEMEDALARIVSSERFVRSSRNRELLTYLVSELRAGRGEAIGGTSVAQDVFGKGAEFDPATDPSVRVQMGRLRKMLAEYYDSDGRRDPTRIVIPKASYVPLLAKADAMPTASGDILGKDDADRSDDDVRTEPEAEKETRTPGNASAFATHAKGWRRFAMATRAHPVVSGMIVVALFVLGTLGAAGFMGLRDDPSRDALAYPTILVEPFVNGTGDPENSVLERGLQRQISADLERFRSARVTLGSRSQVEGNESVRPNIYMTGTILGTQPELDLLVELTDAQSGAVVDRERIRIDAEGDYLDAVEDFSRIVSSHVGGPRGRLTRAMRRHFDEHPLDLESDDDLAAFACLSRFHAFESARNEEEHGRVRDCLALHSGTRPEDGTLLSALAWTLLLGSAEAGLLDTSNAHPPHDPSYALELAERAVAVDPANDDAHEYLGLIEWFTGNRARALESLRRAVRLNPANAQHRSNYGLFSILAGENERGVGLLQEAIAWDPDPPHWYATGLVHDALMRGDGERALEVIDEGATKGDPFEPVYRLAAAAIAGESAIVDATMPLVMERVEENDGDALAGARAWLNGTEVLSILAAQLNELGVPTEPPVDPSLPSADMRRAALSNS